MQMKRKCINVTIANNTNIVIQWKKIAHEHKHHNITHLQNKWYCTLDNNKLAQGLPTPKPNDNSIQQVEGLTA